MFKSPAVDRNAKTVDLMYPTAEILFQQLLQSSIVAGEDWDRLLPELRSDLTACKKPSGLLPKLAQYGLLTDYQSDRIESGATVGLVLGNYRILERIGAGSMGVVFKAEHVNLRRTVAIKVLTLSSLNDPRALGRFNAEIRAVAGLQHPNIVSAMDAGTCPALEPGSPHVRYFVMEYVPGRDLEELVAQDGPMAPIQACDIIHQIASALAEADEHHLVHRDIKPSNIRVTPEGQAKLLDFGLARDWNYRMTQPGTMLGTLNYIAPEQAMDAGSVDIRADIFALGGTLYWCLTAQVPFPLRVNLADDLTRRRTQSAPSVRALRPETPVELDAVVARMMAPRPSDRFASPRAIMPALLPFLKPNSLGLSGIQIGSRNSAERSSSLTDDHGNKAHRIVIVDDNAQVRDFSKYALESDDLICDLATDGEQGLRMVRETDYDLVLLDVDMPGMTGHQVCRALREDPPSPNLKIILFSGRATPDEMAQIINDGADDFISKPFSVIQLQARVRAALRLRDAQQRAELLNDRLIAVNRSLETTISNNDADFNLTRKTLVMALAELIGVRGEDPAAHLARMQHYCRLLAEQLSRTERGGALIDNSFIDLLEACVPLHDIGNAALPDPLLSKPGPLSMEDRLFIQTHTTIGADVLDRVAAKYGLIGAFLEIARGVIRHHHERYDGTGYPDRLAGDAIPLAARIVGIADVYDALRSKRGHKPPLSHDTTVQIMLNQCPGQFDPSLLELFEKCHADFERIYREVKE